MSTKRQRQRAKKLAKKKKAREQARATRGSRDGMGAQGGKVRVETALRWPVNECYLSSDWYEQGARVHALFTRRSARGRIAVAHFEVDLAEAGVEKAQLKTGLNDLELQMEVANASSEEDPLVTAEPELVVKLVREAWAFAEANGQKQDGRYARAVRLFGDVDPAQCEHDILTGTEPKPTARDSSGWFASLKRRLFKS